MRGRVEFMVFAGRLERHPVPNDLVHAVGNHGIGQQLEIGHLLALPELIGLRVTRTCESVEAREGFRADDRLIRKRGGRRRNSRKGGIEEDRLGFRDVRDRVGAQEIRRRAVTLNSRKGSVPMTNLSEGGVKLADHRGADELAVVVTDVGMGIEISAKFFETIAVARGEFVPELWTPKVVRVEFQRVAKKSGTGPRQTRAKRRHHGRRVGFQGVAIQVIERIQRACRPIFPRAAQRLSRRSFK
jgi:hypothetical protein